MRAISITMLAAAALIGFFVAALPAPAQIKAKAGPVASAIDRAAVERARTRVQRREVTRGIVGRLKLHLKTSPDAARLSAALQLKLDRDSIRETSRLDAAIADLQRPRATSRDRSLQTLGAEVLDRAAHFTAMMGKGQYDSEDAARLLNIAKYGSQLADDLRNPKDAISGENARKTTKFLIAAYGAAAVTHGTLDGDGRAIMDGVRDLTSLSGRFSATGASTIIDIPGEVAAATMTVSRKAMDQASTTIDDIEGAMRNQPGALQRAIANSKKLDGMLSGATYGAAMQDALVSRLADRVPGLRTVLNWWPDAPEPPAPAPVAPAARLVQATGTPLSFKDSRGKVAQFRHGRNAFADRVAGYRMGSPPPSSAIARHPIEATGEPDDAAVSLGCGGVLTLEFIDNRLIDVPGPDLYVFEVGPEVEPTHVEISADGANWLAVGLAAGSTDSVDISGVAQRGVGYRYVRLTDGRRSCGAGSYTGADINAVGAIGSATAPR